MKSKLFFTGVILFGLSVAIFVPIHNRKIAEQKMTALLNGDKSIDIVSFETKYQQRRLICTDTEVLRYIKEIIQKHPSQSTDSAGMSYIGYFKFQNGNTFECYMSVRTNGFDISIPSRAAEESFPTDWFLLVEPIPQKVKQIFEFLGEPKQKDDGTILVLEDGKIPYQKYDASLVAK